MYYVMCLETFSGTRARLVATAETSTEARRIAIAKDAHRNGRPAGRAFFLDDAGYARWNSWIIAREHSYPDTRREPPVSIGATD